MKWIWHWPSIGVSIHVPIDVVEKLKGFRQGERANEQGGQLFIDLSQPDGLWLTEVTPPHAADKSGPTWLELNAMRCEREIAAANKRALKLVGYWHSHPECFPNLSMQDLQSLKKFSKRNNDHLPYPVAVIVGRSLTSDGIRAWAYRDSGPVLAELLIFEN